MALDAKISRSAFIEAVLSRYLRNQMKVKEAHQGDWIGSTKETMKVRGDVASPLDDKDDREKRAHTRR